MRENAAVRPEKAAKVTAAKEKIDASNIMIVTNYSGMTVKQMSELRRKLDPCKAEYRVFKNTYTTIAMGKDHDEFKKNLTGSVAVLFGMEDPVSPTKALFEFIAENEKPQVLGGWFEEKYCELNTLKAISKLPSREELLAKMVGSMQAPISGFVGVLAGTLRKFVYAINAIKDNKPLDSSESLGVKKEGGES